jgi:hypothetical protein
MVDRLGAQAGADPNPAEDVAVLGVPAAGEADDVALAMLGTLVRQAGTAVRVSTILPAGGIHDSVHDSVPAAVLVAAVGPGGLTEARYLCRRLREQHPGAKIVVGRWGRRKDPKKARAFLQSAGADRVTATLAETRAHLARLVHPLLSAPDREHPAV